MVCVVCADREQRRLINLCTSWRTIHQRNVVGGRRRTLLWQRWITKKTRDRERERERERGESYCRWLKCSAKSVNRVWRSKTTRLDSPITNDRATVTWGITSSVSRSRCLAQRSAQWHLANWVMPPTFEIILKIFRSLRHGCHVKFLSSQLDILIIILIMCLGCLPKHWDEYTFLDLVTTILNFLCFLRRLYSVAQLREHNNILPRRL